MEEKVERKCEETIAPDQQKREGKLLLIFLSSFFFSCLAAIGFYPALLFPNNTFWPPEGGGHYNMLFTFASFHRLIRSLRPSSILFFCFVIVRAVQTICVGIHHACISSNGNYNLAYPQSGRLPMLPEMEGTWRNFLFLPLRNWLQGPPFPFVTCACMQPHRHITDTHIHTRISHFFAVGKQLILITPPPPCNNGRCYNSPASGSHTLHHKHTKKIAKTHFGIERKKHGLTNKFTKRTEYEWPIRLAIRTTIWKSFVGTCYRKLRDKNCL